MPQEFGYIRVDGGIDDYIFLIPEDKVEEYEKDKFDIGPASWKNMGYYIRTQRFYRKWKKYLITKDELKGLKVLIQ